MTTGQSFRLLILAVVVGTTNTALCDDSPVGIDLSQVIDRSELTFEESEAYYAVLDEARQTPVTELRQSAADHVQQRWHQSEKFRQWPLEEFPLFYDLTEHPDEYRGRAVTLRGHLVRLVKYAAGPNDYGIDTLYEGWLVTPDSQTHPATIICTEIPEGMPIGEELTDGVSVTGYFFKLRTYPARDKLTHFAPMILAHRLSWSPVASATGWPVPQSTMIVGVLTLAVIMAIVALMIAKRSRRTREQRYRESVPQTPPEFLNDLTP